MKPVISLSGRGPVFGSSELGAARELSSTYLHPLSEFLSLFTPQRVGRPGASAPLWDRAPGSAGSVEVWQLPPFSNPVDHYLPVIEETVGSGAGAIVVVPEVREGSTVLEDLASKLGTITAPVHSSIDEAARSAALWSAASGKVKVLLGGRAAVFAPGMALGLIIVHSEHDVSFKDQRAPYYDARLAALARTQAVGARLILASRTPSVSTIHIAATRGWKLKVPDRQLMRASWPIVEVVEPAPRSPVPRRAIAAILGSKRAGGKSLILLPRRLRTKAGPGPEQVASAVSKIVPDASISRADRGSLEPGQLSQALDADVVVATELAVAEIDHPWFQTCVVLGVDSFLQKHSGRAVEDAFALIFEAATWLRAPAGRSRLLLETSEPEHHLVQGITRGDPGFFIRNELAARLDAGSPPYTTMVRLRAGDMPPDELLTQIRSLSGVEVMGPIPDERGYEMLIRLQDRSEGLASLGTIIRSSSDRLVAEVDPREW